MAPTTIPKIHANIQHIFSSLERPSVILSPKELDFLDFTNIRYLQTGDITDAQFERLQEIYAAHAE